MSRRSLADLLGRSVPLTAQSMARWCEITVAQVEEGLRELEARASSGALGKVGRDAPIRCRSRSATEPTSPRPDH
ncbi:MAG TPA: hypothetical protein VGR25_12700 [bacterium]|nr:hypothetical protein [bacterium]